MNQNLQSSASSGRRLLPEDVVIIVVIVLGLVGSVIIYGLKMPPIMVAVFMSTGVASLVYRFLGGIQSAKLNIGPVKLGGSIAALIGCAWLINMQLEQQTKCDLNRLFTPNVSTWFVIDKDKGIPVEVEIKGIKDSIKKPQSDVLANKELDIRYERNRFTIASMVDSDFLLGRVEIQDLLEINLFNTITCLDGFFVTARLPAGTPNIDLGPIPFKLSTGTYGGGYSRYTLNDSVGEALHEGGIQGRGTEIVKLGGKYYLVGVVEVNHAPEEGKTAYAKFVVGEIVTKIES